MRATPIWGLLAGLPVFSGIDGADLQLLAGCGRNMVVAAGTVLAREGDPADRFFVVRDGKLAVELDAPGGPLVIDTAGPGEVVGWSWIFPPYRWTADVEAVERTRLVAVDGRCLRERCEREAGFGYRLMQRFAEVMARRLEAIHLRLLDLYGAEPHGQRPGVGGVSEHA